MANGTFIISLDFELMWGVRDKLTIAQYGDNIRGVHQVIPRLLKTFRQYDIRGTFSTVGFLFCETRAELLAAVPSVRPAYNDSNLSPYNGYFDQVGENGEQDIYHYAGGLIRQIQQYPEQEIGTHTFSHYYCLEKGQTSEQFKADLEAAIRVAGKYNIRLTSLIFPRNQFNDEYLKICGELGITCYRGNERSWLYTAKNGEKETLIRRAFRLMDSYLNISGFNCYNDESLRGVSPVNVPSSRFLRPYAPGMKSLEWLRMRRIKSAMTHAAKTNKVFHLWWHPHNFGIHQDANLAFLEELLRHYLKLNRQYGFESRTMSEYAQKLIHG